MANQDTAFGLRPIGLNGAGANTTGVTQYEIASTNTTRFTSMVASNSSGGWRYRHCWCRKRWYSTCSWVS